jgi:hypothetical protein
MMLQTVWAEIRNGKIEPLDSIPLPEGAKAIVTFISEDDDERFWLFASEQALAEVWENTEDDIYAQLLEE